jgi:hypothetical protein
MPQPDATAPYPPLNPRKYSWSDQRRRLLTRRQALEHAQPSQAVRGSIEAQRRNGLLLTCTGLFLSKRFSVQCWGQICKLLIAVAAVTVIEAFEPYFRSAAAFPRLTAAIDQSLDTSRELTGDFRGTFVGRAADDPRPCAHRSYRENAGRARARLSLFGLPK